MTIVSRGRVLFEPTAKAIGASRLSRFCRELGRTGTFQVSGEGHAARYRSLHRWSTEEPDSFWLALATHFGVRFSASPAAVLAASRMPGAEWFSGARLNYAEHALRPREGAAVVALSESGARRELSQEELRRQVASCRAGFQRLGVNSGDCIAAYLPNGVEALIGFLACASLGALWTSCPPEFGVNSVLDRFEQVRPKLLLATDTYTYGGKAHSRVDELQVLTERLSSLTHCVVVSGATASGQRSSPPSSLPETVTFSSLLEHKAELEFEPVPFDHPLWVLYSSGTTGKPKALVHGHGGILLEHLKVLALHSDLGEGDRFFWYSTTGWMMWNYLIGGLLVGATVMLYDGSPNHPDLTALWRLAEREKFTYFGTSAPFLMACRTRQIDLSGIDLSHLRGVGSTGAPLPAEGFEWVYQHVSADVLLGSVSGGTDLCTAFVLSCPWLPVRAGEIQCAALGADVQAFSPKGRPLIGEVGELVITGPMPSMPLYLVGDADGSRYINSYFADYPGVWRHGDWLLKHDDGGCVIFGRSDSTLNRGGVRMGTSEFYRVIEQLPEITDSLVVDSSELGTAGKLWLFVVLRDGVAESSGVLPAELLQKVKQCIRTQLSPRHVPEVVLAVSEIPYTLSGKKLEVPVKRLLQGASLDQVSNLGTLRNPSALVALSEILASVSA